MADLEALTQRFYSEVFNKGDMEVLDELVDDSFVEHEDFPGIPPGKEGLKAFLATTRAAFPDLQFELVAMISKGDEVWVHGVMRGTHQGEFMGIPASGRTIEVTAIDRIRVRNDKAVEHWGVTDTLTMMQQLGAIPE
jgi:steroid delta-isomerase-like uncharacterized protein